MVRLRANLSAKHLELRDDIASIKATLHELIDTIQGAS
jgi:hypothetical protein